MRFRFIILLLAFYFAVISHSSIVWAVPEYEQKAIEFSSEVMSPFCPGRTLSSCPSGDARELRLEVKRLFQFGRTPEEVQEILQAKFPGFNFGGVPETEGFGLVAWTLPTIFILLLTAVILILLSGMRRIEEEDNKPVSLDPDFEAKVNAELERRLKD